MPRAGMFMWMKLMCVQDFDDGATAAFVDNRIVPVSSTDL